MPPAAPRTATLASEEVVEEKARVDWVRRALMALVAKRLTIMVGWFVCCMFEVFAFAIEGWLENEGCQKLGGACCCWLLVLANDEIRTPDSSLFALNLWHRKRVDMKDLLMA